MTPPHPQLSAPAPAARPLAPPLRSLASRRPRLALALLCLLLWLPGFFSLPPSDRDESRFVQATRQMLETGDIVAIRNGTAPRNQKPIGIYWLQLPFAAAARAAALATANPVWPYRLPSLLGGLLAVLATFEAGLLLTPPSAFLAAAFLAGTTLLTVEVHIAKTDAALLGVTTLAMALLARAVLRPESVGRGAALLFWAALAAGILIKGPITPMVVLLTLAALWLTARSDPWPRRLAALRPLTGLALLLLLVLPWFLAIGLATHGQFFAQSAGGDLAKKLAGADNAHGAPFGTHLALMPLLVFGGGIAAIAGAPRIAAARKQPELRFLLAWLLPAWLVFEAVPTKLPHYTLPLYPALCLLASWSLHHGARTPPPPWSGRLASLLGLAATATIGAAALALPLVLHAAPWPALPAAFTAAAIFAVAAWRFPNPWHTARAMLAGSVLLFPCLLGLELPALTPLWIAPRVAAALRNAGIPDRNFGALGYAEPSLMFACGTQTSLFGAAPPAMRFLLATPGRVLLVDQNSLPALQHLLGPAAALAPITRIGGFNYSNGRRVTLWLLRRA